MEPLPDNCVGADGRVVAYADPDAVQAHQGLAAVGGVAALLRYPL